MSTLYLYNTIAPNLNGGLHYISLTPTMYVCKLGTAYTTVEQQSYEITENIVRVANITEAQMRKTCYIREKDGNYNRYYNVLNSEWVSGYAVLYVKPDVWANANEIGFFSSLSINANQCNKILSAPYNVVQKPAQIDYSYRQLTTTEMPSLPTSFNDLSIVFSVAYVVGDTPIWNNNKGSFVQLFYAKVNGFKTLSNNPISDYPVLEQAAAFVGGITEIVIVDGTSTSKVKANVLRAFIVPTSWVQPSKGPATTVSMLSFTSAVATKNIDWLASGYLMPSRNDFPITLSSLTLGSPTLVGTLQNRLEVFRTLTKQATITIHTCIAQNGLQIIGENNGKLSDITDAFEIDLSINGGNVTALQNVQNSIATLTNVIGNVGRIAAGDYVGGALGLLNNTLSVFKNNDSPTFRGGGDGKQTWSNASGNFHVYFGVWTPLLPTGMLETIKRYGVEYSGITSIWSIANADFIDADTTERPIYIRGEIVPTSTTTLQASDYAEIASTLQQGIFVEYIWQ